MRKLTYILLAAVVLQAMGLKLLCSPLAPTTHDCCPRPCEAPAKKSQALPWCCQISTLPYQGTSAESTTVQQVETLPVTSVNGVPLHPVDLLVMAAVSPAALSGKLSSIESIASDLPVADIVPYP